VGIEGLVPHGLRHTTAALAISAGANVKVVQRLLGHATAAMTLDLCGHLLDDDLSKVATQLGRAINSAAISLRYRCGIQPNNGTSTSLLGIAKIVLTGQGAVAQLVRAADS